MESVTPPYCWTTLTELSPHKTFSSKKNSGHEEPTNQVITRLQALDLCFPWSTMAELDKQLKHYEQRIADPTISKEEVCTNLIYSSHGPSQPSPCHVTLIEGQEKKGRQSELLTGSMFCFTGSISEPLFRTSQAATSPCTLLSSISDLVDGQSLWDILSFTH